jgi:uncharacterized protein YecA (UPF0149 family)
LPALFKWNIGKLRIFGASQFRFIDVCGRNDPCPCGSGKKYKKCHGA